MLAGAVLLSFASCSSDDENGPIATTSNAIAFNVNVPRASRAATTPTNTQSIEAFNVWGFVDGNTFMENVSVTGGQGNWSYNPVMYWPADEQKVNFYGVSPLISTAIEPDGNNYSINEFNNGGTTDLLYSVNIGESRTGSNPAPVNVNFRHALSQVRVAMQREYFENPQNQLRVEVTGVDLLQTYSVASFNYPKETTSLNTPTPGSVGTWHDQTALKDFTLYNGKAVTLKDDAEEANSTGFAFAIPQVLPESTQGQDSYNGAYIRVKCAIYSQLAGVKLWPSTSTPGYDESSGQAYLYFPIKSANATVGEWEPGKAYVYTITIGVPSGTGQIGFDVTVDEYKDFSQSIID